MALPGASAVCPTWRSDALLKKCVGTRSDTLLEREAEPNVATNPALDTDALKRVAALRAWVGALR
jgi:hypothetical protein